jgi:hypothetical protein
MKPITSLRFRHGTMRGTPLFCLIMTLCGCRMGGPVRELRAGPTSRSVIVVANSPERVEAFVGQFMREIAAASWTVFEGPLPNSGPSSSMLLELKEDPKAVHISEGLSLRYRTLLLRRFEEGSLAGMQEGGLDDLETSAESGCVLQVFYEGHSVELASDAVFFVGSMGCSNHTPMHIGESFSEREKLSQLPPGCTDWKVVGVLTTEREVAAALLAAQRASRRSISELEAIFGKPIVVEDM